MDILLCSPSTERKENVRYINVMYTPFEKILERKENRQFYHSSKCNQKTCSVLRKSFYESHLKTKTEQTNEVFFNVWSKEKNIE